ncbi:amino acid adenylation domain-containing protein/natural product biosynthesis luciferase-like monooxygenase protein [Stackebrandtia albiflava]|uniref:Amino acid adenylation domain-containing protein/natural product biosynthesis luciferase-like monooxygenase protein n=1 Tax=Stackebrandtia albiflava TaxID=406432 RepID=A0A562VAT5_9ACTN|nr:non-ribosomal peptide synthetase [Stackebrandtia albiflava]TWJ14975.1 amino acid adenylation domain-containing protein/natural product biosynthesis luciferase-like monooxygenase protein [Stackebrandtia albiflava]
MSDDTHRAQLERRVVAVVAEQLGRPAEEITGDTGFLDLGADSLLLVSLTRHLERETGVRVSMRELFSDADTPARLARLVADRATGTTSPEAAPTAPTTTTAPAAPVTAPPTTPPAPPAAPADVPPPPPPAVPAATGLPTTTPTRLLAGIAELVARDTERPGTDPAVAAAQVRLLGRIADLVAGGLDEPSPTPPATPTGRDTDGDGDGDGDGDEYIEDGEHTGPDFSVYFFGDYPRDEAADEKYRFIVDATRFADRHGFHAAWLPERHFHSFGGLFPNPSVLAAALARETSRIRLHAGSVVLPLHQTVRVAEEWSVVDNLSGGRAGICVASGWHANDFALFPERYGRHRDSMYEQLDDLRRLWRGEAITATSGSGDDIDIRLYPRPIQQMPPLYAAVVGNPDSYRLAAEAGIGIVTNLMTQSIPQLAERVRSYRQARADAGLDPAGGRVVVLLHTYLGDDEATVRRQALGPFTRYMRSSLGLLGQAVNSLGMSIDVATTPEEDMEFLLEQAFQRYCESRALIGTVDGCSHIVDQLIDAGVDEIAAFLDFGLDPADAVAGLPHLDRLRRRFRNARTAPATTATAPAPRSEATPLPPAPAAPPEPDSAPLTYAQERFWLAEQLFPEESTYNEVRAVRLRGELDAAALEDALRSLARRHVTLRSTIRLRDGSPVQVAGDGSAIRMPVIDHTGESETDVVARTMAAESAHRFDVAQGPLFRPRLLRFAPDHHVLFLNAHHAVIDTVSGYILAAEVSELYRAHIAGEDPRLPELPVDYFTHARRQRLDADHTTDLAYWARTLAGDLPVLALPTDRPRPAVLAPTGASVVGYLPKDLSEQAREFSRRHRSTMFMTLLTGFAAALSRITGQREAVIGAALADRPGETERLIGAMLNTVPLRITSDPDENFTDLLERVRDTTMDAYQHGGVPFERILDTVRPPRDTSRTPLFQVLVVFENEEVFDLNLPGVEATVLDAVPDRAIYDLTLYLGNLPDGVRVHAEYNTRLFDETTVHRFIRQFESVLRHALDRPEAPLRAVTALPEPDRAVLDGWQTGPPAAPDGPPPWRHVARHATEQPDLLAMETAETALSYHDLDVLADALAERLAPLGEQPVVAMRLPRGPALLVAQLAVFRRGGVCLPIDHSQPAERMRVMLLDGGATVLLTDADTPAPDGVATWRLDEFGRPTHPTDAPEPTPVPGLASDTAFLLFTSGSTGRPKPVPIAHHAVDNVCQWYIGRTGLTTGTRTTTTGSLGFDLSIMEIWSALTAGATLVVPTEEARHDPVAMTRWLTEQRIEVVWLPTVLAEGVVSLPESDRLPTRVITTAGSALRVAPRPTAPFALVNGYGPAEATILATHATVPPGAEVIPIGRPLPGYRVRLLDEDGEQVSPGVTGELYIGGTGVTSGYLNRPELTAERFTTTTAGELLYRTGDLARWNHRGELEFLGRNDDQVQIRGYRVEPGEVAAALRALPGIDDAAVLGEGDPPELVAHVATADPVEPRTLIERLRRRLPDHMIPRRFAFLPRLPLNPNGKLDRTRLPEAAAPELAPRREPTGRETEVITLWRAELDIAHIDPETSFFDLGGDSLAAARLVAKIRHTTGDPYPLLDFFRAPTVAAMAARLGDAAPRPETTAGTGRVRGSV